MSEQHPLLPDRQKSKASFRLQVSMQIVALGVVVALAAAALVYANESRDTANAASNQSDAGAKACQRLVNTYASGVRLRRVLRSELKTNADIRRKTAEVYIALANLSPKPSPAKTKILALARDYQEAAANSLAHRDKIDIPAKPRCDV